MDESFAAGLVGIVLDGRYRLDALLGEGGMGAVFRAHHLAMDRKVAVKLLKPHLTNDDKALQRFAREARATMKVDSEHAVKVLDFGVTPQRDYYIVLEYLDGRTVQKELEIDGPFAPARVVHIAKQTLHALGAAHKSGLIHRDIKPDNILLMRVGDDPDYTKVLDFGVAKLMEGAASSSRSALAITQAGMVFGTPEFMSPEQACGMTLDPRSDLYSLAATMFAMLTNCGMYKAKTAIEWLTMHARTPPPHLSDGLPELAPFKALDRALQRCFSKQRDDRPQTAEEMIALLTSIESTLGGKSAGPARTPDDPSAASTERGRLMVSPSTYIEALSQEVLPDPNATLLPGQAQITASPGGRPALEHVRPTATGNDGPTTTGVIAQVQGKRHGLWLVLGGLAITGMIVAVIVVATRKRTNVSGERPAVVAKETEPRDAAVPIDAPAVVAIADAAVAAPIDAGSVAASRPVSKTNPEAARLVAEAEEAKKAGNRIRTIMKADAALQADPRNVRARFLLAEALIASGDLDRGCKYLRDLGRNPTARDLARTAGCPSN